MPISRNGKAYYTEEQYNIARYESSALEYARAAGYRLIQKGGYYAMADHDSFVFAPNGMWFWNSRDMKGGAIEFLTQVEHLSQVEAVLTLAGERVNERARRTRLPTETPPALYRKQENTAEKKPFELPPKADNYKRLFAYLCNTRGLDKEIVQSMVRQGQLYEGVTQYKTADGEIAHFHNAVFVGTDRDGTPRNGFMRGLGTTVSYKGEVEGSDKTYPFVLGGEGRARTLAIFEASIDAVSHATIAKMDGQDWRDTDRIAVGGNAPPESYLRYLAAHPEIKSVVICTDNDKAGNLFAQKIRAALLEAGYTKEQGYQCSRQIPTGHKDFNEYLMSCRALETERAEEQHPEQEEDGIFPENRAEGLERS